MTKRIWLLLVALSASCFAQIQNPTTGTVNAATSVTADNMATSAVFTVGSVTATASTLASYQYITLPQTTASITISLPTPSSSGEWYFYNSGSASFTLLGGTVSPGQWASAIYNGSWSLEGTPGGSLAVQQSQGGTGATTQAGAFTNIVSPGGAFTGNVAQGVASSKTGQETFYNSGFSGGAQITATGQASTYALTIPALTAADTFMTTGTAQTVSGAKTFSSIATFQNGLLVSGAQFSVSSSNSPSISPVWIRNVPYTAGTSTTNFPVHLFQTSTPSAAVTSWSTAGTYLGFNAQTGFTGNYLDAHLAGAGSTFNVNYLGAISSGLASTATGGLTLANSGSAYTQTLASNASAANATTFSLPTTTSTTDTLLSLGSRNISTASAMTPANVFSMASTTWTSVTAGGTAVSVSIPAAGMWRIRCKGLWEASSTSYNTNIGLTYSGNTSYDVAIGAYGASAIQQASSTSPGAHILMTMVPAAAASWVGWYFDDEILSTGAVTATLAISSTSASGTSYIWYPMCRAD